jgi:hypothetical protein
MPARARAIAIGAHHGQLASSNDWPGRHPWTECGSCTLSLRYPSRITRSVVVPPLALPRRPALPGRQVVDSLPTAAVVATRRQAAVESVEHLGIHPSYLQRADVRTDVLVGAG